MSQYFLNNVLKIYIFTNKSLETEDYKQTQRNHKELLRQLAGFFLFFLFADFFFNLN